MCPLDQTLHKGAIFTATDVSVTDVHLNIDIQSEEQI